MGKGLEYNAEPGDIYITDEGSVWRVAGFQSSPTVILERVFPYTKNEEGGFDYHRETHAVGCLNAKRFTRLKPVGEE